MTILPQPLIRIVRMTFRPDVTGVFLDIFDHTSPKIRAFPGCTHLELWQDTASDCIFTSYSHWKDTNALETYRQSLFFRETWQKVKPLFASPPVVYSYYLYRSVLSE